MQIQLNKKGSAFSTRPRAHEVFDNISTEKNATIDFNGVERATPSFLHEMLLIFKKRDTSLHIENMNKSIEFQLEKAKKAMN